jgi:hypothetical protein
MPDETIAIDFEKNDEHDQARSETDLVRVPVEDMIRMRESGWIGSVIYHKYTELV